MHVHFWNSVDRCILDILILRQRFWFCKIEKNHNDHIFWDKNLFTQLTTLERHFSISLLVDEHHILTTNIQILNKKNCLLHITQMNFLQRPNGCL